MAKRVAITIAGAVSLGSYEAGVTYELLEALRTHNEACDQAGTTDAKIYVDVITGASAGGMTAAMLGQCLMYYGDELKGADSNPLYHAWVKRISLWGLVCMGWKEKKWHSLFSSDLIMKIGEEMLIDPLKKLTAAKPHAAIEVADGKAVPLKAGVALTNLNGVDYMLPIAGSGKPSVLASGSAQMGVDAHREFLVHHNASTAEGFNYTRSVDQLTFDVEESGWDLGQAENRRNWDRVHHAAVACGAFPVAFRPQPIERTVEEYGERLQSQPVPPPVGTTYVDWRWKGAHHFAYTDGGVLQNQPLGIAKNLIDMKVRALLDEEKPEESEAMAADRLYAFISPNAVTSSAIEVAAPKISIGKMLVELFHTYLRQAMFHDWIVAEGMNEKVLVLDKRAAELAARLSSGVLDASCLLPASEALNQQLIPDAVERGRTLARLENQYAVEFALASQAGADAGKAFVNAIATLEAAAELQLRDKMKIIAVMADGRKELAGSGIAAFAGFFSRRFREYDYWVGRVKARVYLQRPDVKSILSVAQWPEEASWGGTSVAQVQGRLPVPVIAKGLKVPIGLLTMLAPAILPLGWFLFLRVWPIVVIAVLIGLGWWGHAGHWHL